MRIHVQFGQEVYVLNVSRKRVIGCALQGGYEQRMIGRLSEVPSVGGYISVNSAGRVAVTDEEVLMSQGRIIRITSESLDDID